MNRHQLSDGIIWCAFMGVLVAFASADPRNISRDSTTTTICDAGTDLNPIDCEVREPDVPILRRSKRHIQAGTGYSEDMLQVRPQLCYKVAGTSLATKPISKIRLTSSRSGSTMSDELGISASIGGSYGLFAADATANYFKSLDQDSQSISFNYYHYGSSPVSVQIAGVGIEALTDFGKNLYKTNNPYFGLLCGDNYISEYEYGVLLTMGLNVKLSSAAEKTELSGKLKASYASFASVSTDLKSIAANSNISATVTLQALQIGGEPSQLAKIFGEDDSGNSHALACDLQKMDDCIRAASALLAYAKHDFTTQFSFKKGMEKGLSPLGPGFAKYTAIKWTGLTAPHTLVTDEISRYREELAHELKANVYYRERLSHFVNGDYPLKLDIAFINKLNPLLSRAERNIQILKRPHGGGADCFNDPENCKKTKEMIDFQLEKITPRDLQFLEAIRYTILVEAGILYNIGGESGRAWDIKLHNSAQNIKVLEVNTDSDKLEYTLYLPSDGPRKISYTGILNGGRTGYKGRLCRYPKCDPMSRPTSSIGRLCLYPSCEPRYKDLIDEWCPGTPDCKDDVFHERTIEKYFFAPYPEWRYQRH